VCSPKVAPGDRQGPAGGRLATARRHPRSSASGTLRVRLCPYTAGGIATPDPQDSCVAQSAREAKVPALTQSDICRPATRPLGGVKCPLTPAPATSCSRDRVTRMPFRCRLSLGRGQRHQAGGRDRPAPPSTGARRCSTTSRTRPRPRPSPAIHLPPRTRPALSLAGTCAWSEHPVKTGRWVVYGHGIRGETITSLAPRRMMESARWSFDAVAARSVVSDLLLGNWGGRNLAIVRGPVKTPLRGLELPSDRVIRVVGCAQWCEGRGSWLNLLPVCATDTGGDHDDA
jgi:hypothetical protein